MEEKVDNRIKNDENIIKNNKNETKIDKIDKKVVNDDHDVNNNDDDDDDDKDSFNCSICLDNPFEPVTTVCGHVFCWGCLYKWLEKFDSCPVCRAGCTKENVIPIYGRGKKQRDPRKHSDKIPERPKGRRPEQRNTPRGNGGRRGFSNGRNVSYGFSFGGFFLPSLFSFSYSSSNSGQVQEENEQQAFLSNLLLALGSFVILFLLLF